MSRGLHLLLTFSVGLIAANIYYAQPLVSLISKSLLIPAPLAGLVVMLTQVGYGLGVLFLVPLGDILENKKLLLTQISVLVISLLAMSFVSQKGPYFFAAFTLGLGASALQIIVPYAAHLSPEATRGRVVGGLMSGLMLGIMLSRPLASFVSDLFSWHGIFMISATLMFILGGVLWGFLPQRQPHHHKALSYASLLGSMVQLLMRTPVLRRRGFYQACLFGSFSLFWTTTPLLLAGPEFRLSQTQIAFFALAGVSGAVVAPLAGRVADAGWIRPATALAMICAMISFVLSRVFTYGSLLSLGMLVFSAILLDASITANLVLGQRAIFSLRAKYRSRLNGLYTALIFVGGAIGSFAGAWAYAKGGWDWTSYVGFVLPSVAFVVFLTETGSMFQRSRSFRSRSTS